MKNRLSIRAIACFVLLGLPLAGCDSDSSDNSIQSKSIERPYTIVAIPDTQVYSEEDNLTPVFKKQVDWVLENRSKENIVFATHLGDVVDNADSQDQWDNAVKALESFLRLQLILYIQFHRAIMTESNFLRNTLGQSVMQEKAGTSELLRTSSITPRHSRSNTGHFFI